MAQKLEYAKIELFVRFLKFFQYMPRKSDFTKKNLLCSFTKRPNCQDKGPQSSIDGHLDPRPVGPRQTLLDIDRKLERPRGTIDF